MATTQPIRSIEDIQKLKNYYLEREEYSYYLLATICLNTALRICDVLNLKWSDIINLNTKQFKKYICVVEAKTGKIARIKINKSIKNAINFYIKNVELKEGYIFENTKGEKLSRVTVYYAVKRAGKAIGLEYEISCHSLRKTFGYHAWKNGTPPAVLMQIYNHSSYEITKRYLGIAQEDKDRVYMSMVL